MKRIYLFLIYLFVWAGKISLHDEQLGAVGDLQSALKAATSSTPMTWCALQSGATKATDTVFTFVAKQLSTIHSTCFQQTLLTLRLQLSLIGECPQVHRARLRFSSD